MITELGSAMQGSPAAGNDPPASAARLPYSRLQCCAGCARSSMRGYEIP